ncbi:MULTISPECIES: LysR family transcriptional regulator [unclassified Pseudomonas]|uniref:LysR family transcriptional regulator n=1 Tax=unclassified Pseudomonas TaxID=196821 RepID=UPI0030D8B596
MYPISLLHHLDLTTLKLLLSISEEGNLTRGARRESIAISAASKRLLGLEQAIGLPLFIRKSKGMTLTAAGETLLDHARQMLQGAQQIHAALMEHARQAQDCVRVAANPSSIAQFVPDDVSHFLNAHKRICVDLQEDSSLNVLQAVEAGKADIGVYADNGVPHDLYCEPYRQDRLIMVVHHKHPLAARGQIRFEESLDNYHIGLHGNDWILNHAMKSSLEAGKPLNIQTQVPSFEVLCRMVQAGVGVGLIPYQVFKSLGPPKNLVSLDLRDEWATRHLKVVVRDPRHLSPAAGKLFTHLTQANNEHRAGVWLVRPGERVAGGNPHQLFMS